MTPHAAMPPPVALGLTAAVLAAHLWLLHARAVRFAPAPTVAPAPLLARAIPAAAPPAAEPVEVRPASRLPTPFPGGSPLAGARRGPPAGAPEPLPSPAAAAGERPAAEASPAPVSIPPSVRLRYRVTARVKQQASEGESELDWQHDGGRYEARFSVVTAGSRPRVQHSAGRVGGAGLEPLRFGDRSRVVEGQELLELPGGALAAIKLARPPRGEFDQRVEVWLAPGLAYAPVRLRLTQPNGDWTDHQWSGTDRR